MILSDLRTYLKQQQRVALRDLSIHFNMDADALRGMLSKWVNKGRVRKTALETACGTQCCKCDASLTEIYEWVEN
ncbi:MAG: FeoC-like transcriptional regulator [Methylovulum sp.]|jgi:hypothetical protein|nr:FeoC-like transcriptional regulator [Methylovulum sp.]MCF7998932.1 FeoC-like transcriptional regulator [Methylovulum sp.]